MCVCGSVHFAGFTESDRFHRSIVSFFFAVIIEENYDCGRGFGGGGAVLYLFIYLFICLIIRCLLYTSRCV